jgi:hypothetical protein
MGERLTTAQLENDAIFTGIMLLIATCTYLAIETIYPESGSD